MHCNLSVLHQLPIRFGLRFNHHIRYHTRRIKAKVIVKNIWVYLVVPHLVAFLGFFRQFIHSKTNRYVMTHGLVCLFTPWSSIIHLKANPNRRMGYTVQSIWQKFWRDSHDCNFLTTGVQSNWLPRPDIEWGECPFVFTGLMIHG